jgi:hypothetical protein
MFKKFILIIAMIFLLLVGNTFAGQITSREKDLDVFINDQELNLSSSPIVDNDKILLPLRDFLESIGTTVYWNSDSRMITVYKDNTFVKMQIDSKVAYKNGKSFTLRNAPEIINGKTYVPVEFFIETFNMLLNVEDNNVFIKSSNDEIDSYRKFDDFFYKEIIIDEEDIRFSIPQYWNILNKVDFEYGFADGYENIHLKMITSVDSEINDLEKLTDNFKDSITRTYSDNITFTGSTKENINGLESNIVYYTIQQNNQTTKFISYILKAHHNNYILNFSYTPTEDETDSINTINNIMSTFNLAKITVDTALEHYVEYPEFLENSFQIKTELFSNMETKGSFTLEGSTKNQLIDTLVIEISKGNKIYTQIIPVSEGNFKDTVYLPFGLGKHNVCIEATKLDNVISEIINPTKNDSLVETTTKSTIKLVDSSVVENNDENIISENNMVIEEDELNKDIKIFDEIDKLEDSKVEKSDLYSESHIISEPILKFSILNLNPSKTIYLLPTPMVQNNFEEVFILAKGKTSGIYSDSGKAKALYNYMLENITYNENIEALSSVKTLKNREGNSLSLNYLYASLLRSVDIPTKVVEGEILGNKGYWVQMKINGRWITSDVTSGILSKNILDIKEVTPSETTTDSTIEIVSPEVEIKVEPIVYLFVNDDSKYVVNEILE